MQYTAQTDCDVFPWVLEWMGTCAVLSDGVSAVIGDYSGFAVTTKYINHFSTVSKILYKGPCIYTVFIYIHQLLAPFKIYYALGIVNIIKDSHPSMLDSLLIHGSDLAPLSSRVFFKDISLTSKFTSIQQH